MDALFCFCLCFTSSRFALLAVWCLSKLSKWSVTILSLHISSYTHLSQPFTAFSPLQALACSKHKHATYLTALISNAFTSFPFYSWLLLTLGKRREDGGRPKNMERKASSFPKQLGRQVIPLSNHEALSHETSLNPV